MALIRNICTSMAVKPRLWTSSMPSLSVLPLHESGIPAGPNRIMDNHHQYKSKTSKRRLYLIIFIPNEEDELFINLRLRIVCK